LKELCRKLPTTEKELNSNYIFGVGAKFLQKYGKLFLPEIIKHVKMYEIDKSEKEYETVVRTSIAYSSKKRKTLENSTLKHASNSLATNVKYSEGIKDTLYSENIYKNNVAMFNSMSDKKQEIHVDINNSSIKAKDSNILNNFLIDMEKLSNDKKKIEKNDLSDLFDFIEDKEEILHEDFNDFEDINAINNLEDAVSFFNKVENPDNSEDDSFNDLSKEVKKMNNLIDKNNKRSRKDQLSDNDEVGGKKAKKANGSTNYYKRNAIYKKINANRKKFKQNNFN